MSRLPSFANIWPLSIALTLFALVVPGWLALQTPWLGVEFTAEHGAEGLVVASVADNGPSAGVLVPGDRVLALRSAITDTDVALSAETLTEEPDILNDYQRYNRFFSEQSAIYELLSAGQVLLRSERGMVAVEPASRPLGDLPAMFWFQIVCGLFTAITALAVYSHARENPASLALLLTGITFYFVTLASAPYSTRELALDGPLFLLLNSVNHLGSMTFTAAFIALFWSYPSPLRPLPVLAWSLLIYFGWWLADSFQIFHSFDVGLRWPILMGLLLAIVFSMLQWWRNRYNARELTALKWFIVSIMASSILFIALLILPPIAGYQLIIPQGYTFGFLALVYLGLALGVARYRLFDLQQWWTRLWIWLLGGAMIIASDLLLVTTLKLDHPLALAISLAMIGWFYFPMRQWVARRIFADEYPEPEAYLDELVLVGLHWSNPGRLSAVLEALFTKAFNPLELEFGADEVSRVSLADDGKTLLLPALGRLRPLALHMPHRGRRLFTRRDAAFAERLLRLCHHVIDSQSSFTRGVESERTRIYSDLHDDLGAKLLSMVYRAGDAELSDLARSALQDLRDVVSRSENNAASLDELIADWRAETELRLEGAGIELVWNQTADIARHTASSPLVLNLGRIIREAVSNVIKHAAADRLTVDVASVDGVLTIDISDNGLGIPLAGECSGRGVKNMCRRAQKLGGTIEWRPADPSGCSVHLSVPLPKVLERRIAHQAP